MSDTINIWKVTEMKLVDNDESLEISFAKKEGLGRHTITMNIDSWVEGMHAVWRMQRFENALYKANQILEGKS